MVETERRSGNAEEGDRREGGEVESCNFRAIWTTCYGKECMCLCRRVKEQMKRREVERGGGGKKRAGRDLN